MRLSLFLTASVAAGLLAADAGAGEAAGTTGSTVTLARHYTTDALDGPPAVADWYTALRGALIHEMPHDRGATKLNAAFELRRHDTWDIEDDAAFALGVETGIAASESVELRGTLSIAHTLQGDDFSSGGFVIGTTTRTLSLAAGVQAGIRLSTDTVLALEATASRERSGDTHFQDGLILPARLEPDRDRFRFAAMLTRTHGRFSYGLSAAAGLLRAGETALLPEVAVTDHAVRLHAGLTFDNGATLSAAAGLQTLRLTEGGSFAATRPVFELAAAAPLPAGFSLRGTLKCGYDTIVTDDPVASRTRRGEAEASYRHGPRLLLGAGVFAEKRDNLALGNQEQARGVFGQATWTANERIDLVLRIAAARRVTTPTAATRRSLDASLAVTAKL